jgi:hypothetical protein
LLGDGIARKQVKAGAVRNRMLHPNENAIIFSVFVGIRSLSQTKPSRVIVI